MWSLFGEKWLADKGAAIVSLQFAVVHEAPADFQTATELADRVLVESIDWMEEDLIEHQRTWLRECERGAADLEANQAIGSGRRNQRDRVLRRGACPARCSSRPPSDPLPSTRAPRPGRRAADTGPRRSTGASSGAGPGPTTRGRPAPGGRGVGRRRAGKLGDQWVRPARRSRGIARWRRNGRRSGSTPGCEATSSPRARMTTPHAARSAFFACSAVETPTANAAAGAKHCWRPYVTVARRMDWARFWTRYGRNSAA